MTDRSDETSAAEAERREAVESRQTVANDAVAGETVLPGPGEGNDGPTGGAARERGPVYAENDLADEEIDLGDEPEGADGS